MQPQQRFRPLGVATRSQRAAQQQRLARLNVVACIVHALQAVAIAVVVAVQRKGTGFVRAYSFSAQIFCKSYTLAYLLPVFSTLSAIGHAVAARRIGRGQLLGPPNGARWAEYAVSAGVMLWLIASLSGADSLGELLLLLVGNAVLMWCGYVVEGAEAMRGNGADMRFLMIQASNIAWMLHLALWAVIALPFFHAVRRGGSDTPAMVYAIVPTLFFTHSLFGFVQALYVHGKIGWEAQERAYAFLSLAAKSLLAWMTVGGALRDLDSEEAAIVRCA